MRWLLYVGYTTLLPSLTCSGQISSPELARRACPLAGINHPGQPSFLRQPDLNPSGRTQFSRLGESGL